MSNYRKGLIALLGIVVILFGFYTWNYVRLQKQLTYLEERYDDVEKLEFKQRTYFIYTSKDYQKFTVRRLHKTWYGDTKLLPTSSYTAIGYNTEVYVDTYDRTVFVFNFKEDNLEKVLFTTDAGRTISIPIELEQKSYNFKYYTFKELGITGDDINEEYGNLGSEVRWIRIN